jgi:prepilin-type N-terminal cleavage/methylation domain-containing protein
MRRRREAGFSLYELMIVTAVMGGVAAAIAGVTHAVHKADRASAAYAQDLAELRRAVVAVERDLRAAASFEELRYGLDGGVLTREGRVVARRIGGFRLEREGPLVTARIELLPRAEVPTRTAEVATTVRLRGTR